MINKSDSIAKLALALSRLQGEVKDVVKDTEAYNYKYAKLEGVLEIARPLCLKYEFAVTQLCTTAHELNIGVTTILMHSSGEWVESTLTMPISSVKSANQAQGAGSIITYARRYALAAILGITQIDDDASNAQIHEVLAKKPAPVTLDPEQRYLTLKQLIEDKRLHDKIPAWCEHFKVEQLIDLSDAQMQLLASKIKEIK